MEDDKAAAVAENELLNVGQGLRKAAGLTTEGQPMPKGIAAAAGRAPARAGGRRQPRRGARAAGCPAPPKAAR
jgi:hypothetical protein